MFKWKVSGLGGVGSKKNKSTSVGGSSGTKLNNGSSSLPSNTSSNAPNNANHVNTSSESLRNNKNKEQQRIKDSVEASGAIENKNIGDSSYNGSGDPSSSLTTSVQTQQRGLRGFFGVGGSTSHSNLLSSSSAGAAFPSNNNMANHSNSHNAQPPSNLANGGKTSASTSNVMNGLQEPIFNTRIGSRLANMNSNNAHLSQQSSSSISNRRPNNVPPSRLNLSTEHIYSSSNGGDRLNSSFNKHNHPQTQNNNNVHQGWRVGGPSDPEPTAIPSDSLYSMDDAGNNNNNNRHIPPHHWSSHGYLSKAEGEASQKARNSSNSSSNPPPPSFKKANQQQSLSLPPASLGEDSGERKCFSVRGFSDMRSKHSSSSAEMETRNADKYYSVDARYHTDKSLPMDLRAKLKESRPPYPAPPPPPKATSSSSSSNAPMEKTTSGNLQSSKGLGGSVSWLEWTQQLQAYVAWVNSQLRKRPDLKPVQDLRCDLQSGEVLAQLIDIIAGEKIAGIQYNPESLQGMRENLDRILQFMHSKRIRMHQITSKEILEGNLKAVMRLILALAAHYKPQSVRHHEQNGGIGNTPKDNEGVGSKSTVTNFKDSQQNSSAPLSTGTDSPLNQTQDSFCEALSGSNSGNHCQHQGGSGSGIKRTPSLNESHYSHSSKDRLGPDPEPSQIYENLSSSTETERLIVEEAMASATTQTEAESPLRQQQAMRREGSFVGAGSGRKLPKIPPPSNEITQSNKQQQQQQQSMLIDPRKSKPGALEFWESIEETMDRGDFRYNTIRRMSMGRRILPKPPSSVRSHSLDRSMSGADIRHYEDDKLYSLDSNGGYSDKKSEDFGSPPSSRKKIPADGCSLQSGGSSSGEGIVQEESASSASSRGEVEGSSDTHASPPTSVIGNGEPTWSSSYRIPSTKWTGPSPVSQEYLKELSSEKYSPKYPCRAGDGRQSECSSLDGSSSGHQIPYDVLLQDLTQAKRQLMELHSLDNEAFDSNSSYPTKPFPNRSSGNCNSSESSDIKQLKQNLVRTTLVKQNLEFEKSDLMRKIEDLEKEVNGIRSDVSEREKLIAKLQHKQSNGNQVIVSDQQLKVFYDEELNFAKDAISNLRTSFNEADPNQHILDTLEQCISVIIEKIQNLDGHNNNARSTNNNNNNNIGNAPVSEKKLSLNRPQHHANNSSSNRLNSMLKSNEGNTIKGNLTNGNDGSHGQYPPPNSNLNNNNNNVVAPLPKTIKSHHHASTKILYFTNKSVTPFMSTVPKKIGDIVLRDFKNIFDRPGFYRYHFKTLDQEFGMVKEEISDDDMPLPGTEGKIVVWVEED